MVQLDMSIFCQVTCNVELWFNWMCRVFVNLHVMFGSDLCRTHLIVVSMCILYVVVNTLVKTIKFLLVRNQEFG